MNRVLVLVLPALLLPSPLAVAGQRPLAASSHPQGTVAVNLAPRTLAVPHVALSMIQGNALTSTNGQLPDSMVRLRDARVGRILAAQRTDTAGLFAFRNVEPGSYIVELLGIDEATVVAASQVLNINAGEAVSAVVKLPFRVQPFAGVLGYSVPSAIAVTSAGAASSILAVSTRGEPTCAIGPVR